MAENEYVDPNGDLLDQEIEQSQRATEARQDGEVLDPTNFEIPERFQNKTKEEVARSYVELERRMSQQGQDMGKLRKVVDDLISVQSANAANAVTREPPEKPKPITVDDIYTDADAAIRRVVNEESASKIEALEQELMKERVKAQMTEFGTKYPKWREDANDPSFKDWVRSNNYRIRLATDADRGDFDAADALFSMYYDLKGRAESRAEEEEVRETQLKKATLESGSPSRSSTAKKFSRQELIEKKIAAIHGDPAADRWLKANSAAINKAYREGRVVD